MPRYLLISPAGRSIYDLRATRELLKIIRNTIKAHRYYISMENLLHSDLSENSIIKTVFEEAGNFTSISIKQGW